MKVRILLIAAAVAIVAYAFATGPRYVAPGEYPSIPPRTCLAVTLDVETGEQTETPTPCLQPTETGCTGSITVHLNEDGTVTSTCVPGSGNPSEQ